MFDHTSCPQPTACCEPASGLAALTGALTLEYELTPAELRVLLAIVRESGVPGTARALGIAASTVKTHLKRLFWKTGSARQSDLVKLLAGYSLEFVR